MNTAPILTTPDAIDAWCRERRDGQKIVFTNGCFDLLHAGHVGLLNSAKMLGDFLIVGMNSDKSVKALKGDDRPIICQEQRAFLLASLRAIDLVTIFDDLTPQSLIETIVPDILIKGWDWAGKKVAGSGICRTAVIYKGTIDQSTTKIIDKIAGQAAKPIDSNVRIVGNLDAL